MSMIWRMQRVWLNFMSAWRMYLNMVSMVYVLSFADEYCVQTCIHRTSIRKSQNRIKMSMVAKYAAVAPSVEISQLSTAGVSSMV